MVDDVAAARTMVDGSVFWQYRVAQPKTTYLLDAYVNPAVSDDAAAATAARATGLGISMMRKVGPGI